MSSNVTIIFHKSLLKFTNNTKSFSLYSSSYFEILQACVAIFPKLEKLIKTLGSGKLKSQELVFIVNKKILNINELFLSPKNNSRIILCPILYGMGKSGIIFAGLAILFVAAIVFLPMIAPAVAAATPEMLAVGGVAAASGISVSSLAPMLLGIAFTLVLSLIAPKAGVPSQTQTSDSAQRRNNDIFDGLQNTTRSGQPVSLIYGLDRTSGHFISGYIKTINHGQNDVIKVVNQF